MRRQASAADIAREGSSRLFRLDPLLLPAVYTASDEAADGGTREIEIRSDGVEIRRVVRGVKMRVKRPVSEYRGIAVRVAAIGGREPLIFLTLDHRDAGLSALLQVSAKTAEAAIDARRWSRAFGVPVLIADADGRLRNPAAMRGRNDSSPRRRRRSALHGRRTTIRFRRTRALGNNVPKIHASEREIIARR